MCVRRTCSHLKAAREPWRAYRGGSVWYKPTRDQLQTQRGPVAAASRSPAQCHTNHWPAVKTSRRPARVLPRWRCGRVRTSRWSAWWCYRCCCCPPAADMDAVGKTCRLDRKYLKTVARRGDLGGLRARGAVRVRWDGCLLWRIGEVMRGKGNATRTTCPQAGLRVDTRAPRGAAPGFGKRLQVLRRAAAVTGAAG